MKRPRLRAYLGLGLLAAGLCGLALSGDLLAHSERFVAFYGLSLAGFALLATAATTLPLRGALVAAVVLRIIFLPGMPSLSDDVYRYQWDGRVQQAGINPYRYAPDDPRLDRVGYADRERVNHPAPEDGLPAAGRSDLLRRRRERRRRPRLQAPLRRLRPAHRGGGLVAGRRQTQATGDGAVPALPRGHRTDLGRGASRDRGREPRRARRGRAAARPRLAGRRAPRPGGRLQADAGGAAGAGAARRAGEARPLPRRLHPRADRSLPAVPAERRRLRLPLRERHGLDRRSAPLLAAHAHRRAWGRGDPLCGGVRGRRRVDRPVPAGPGAHGAGFRLDADPARRLPAHRARLVLAGASGPGFGRRHLAAGRDRSGRALPGSARRTLAGAGAAVAATRCDGGVAAARPRGGATLAATGAVPHTERSMRWSNPR